MSWVVQAALHSKYINEVIIATDSDEIAKVALLEGHQKIKIYKRSEASATDKATSESVLIEYLQTCGYGSNDLVYLIQATNPFLKSSDLDAAFDLLKAKKADSLLSVVKSKRFFWDEQAQSVNYDYKHRPRRQEFAGDYMENGSFYISNAAELIKTQNRLHGRIIFYEMENISSYEIDEPQDWAVAEALLNFRESNP